MKKTVTIYNLNSDILNTPILKSAKNVLIKNDILTLDHLTNFSKKEIKNLKGMGLLGMASIQLFLKEVGLTLKKETKLKDENLDLKKGLIFRMLKETEDINWANEIKAANKLFNKYPDINLWKIFSLPFKLNSLYFLLSERGSQFIYKFQKIKKEVVTFKTPEVELQDNKIGKDIVTNKPKSIKDFLNGA